MSSVQFHYTIMPHKKAEKTKATASVWLDLGPGPPATHQDLSGSLTADIVIYCVSSSPHYVSMTITCVSMCDGRFGEKFQFNHLIGKNPYLGIPIIYFDVVFTGMRLNNIGRNRNIIVGLNIFKTLWHHEKLFAKTMAGWELFKRSGCYMQSDLLYLRYIAIIRDNYILLSLYPFMFRLKNVCNINLDCDLKWLLICYKGISDMGLLWPGVVLNGFNYALFSLSWLYTIGKTSVAIIRILN